MVQGSVLSDIPPRDRIPRIEASMRQDPPKGGNAVGKSASVTEAVSGISGVAHAEDVTGPYDCIARVEAGTVDDLGKLVIAKIQEVPGITRTLTCTVVHV